MTKKVKIKCILGVPKILKKIFIFCQFLKILKNIFKKFFQFLTILKNYFEKSFHEKILKIVFFVNFDFCKFFVIKINFEKIKNSLLIFKKVSKVISQIFRVSFLIH